MKNNVFLDHRFTRAVLYLERSGCRRSLPKDHRIFID